MVTMLCFLVGTRAQLIKMAPLISAAKNAPIDFRVWFTGQHGESMSDLMADFGLFADHRYAGNLGERSTVASLFMWLPAAFLSVIRFLRSLKRTNGSAVVVVHGDTLSALVGAVAAKCVGLKVAHVESGLSSGRLLSPFPEEMIRRIVFRFTDVAYCPNWAAMERMQKVRGVRSIYTQGNTIIDSLRVAINSTSPRLYEDPYVVVSLHRFENIFHEVRLRFLVDSIIAIADCFRVCFVLHPATRKRLETTGLMQKMQAHPKVILTGRQSYSTFIAWMRQAEAVLTDGGSNQEELSLMGVPTILMRGASERPDGLGKNAVFEADLGCSVEGYLKAGRHRELRTAHGPDLFPGPSATILADLLDSLA